MRRFTALLVALLCSIGARAFADDPSLRYQTIETPHFLVHYHNGADDYAFKVAIAAEEAHMILAPLLDWVPAEKTHIVATDKVDIANGNANVYGRLHINVFAMPPEADSSLGFYDDWIRILVFHEYVHILHLDTVGGLPKWINKVMGNQWSPNQTMPRWYTEGLATYHESRRTRGGRVDASLFQMYLRASALDDSLYDLGAMSGLPIEWPSGTVAYLYGSSFLDYVFRKHGEEFAPKFNAIYGRRVIPWGLNNISREVSGDTFHAMWGEWNAELKGRAFAKRLAVRARGETALEMITHDGVDMGPPRIRPGHDDVTYNHQDHRTAPGVFSIDPTTRKTERVVELDSSSPGFCWTEDGENVIFTQSVVHKNTYRFRDLFVWNRQRRTTHRLTHQERAREPAVSPDGKKLVYVRNRKGTMELVLRDLRHISGKEQVLISGLEFGPNETGRWQQISMPHFSPDSQKIVFSWWRLDTQNRDIWTVDLKSGERSQLTNDFAADLDPFWDELGIYFSSDRNGIYNIYRVDPTTREVREISNVVNGVFSPAISEDGEWVYVKAYRSHGFDIARFRVPGGRPPAETSQKEIPKINYPDVDVSKFKTTPYAPGKYVAPILFTPQFGVLISGAGFGGNVQGYDPVGHHFYNLTAGYSVGRELTDRGTSIAASYSYSGLPVDINVTGLFRDRPRSRDLFAESEYIPYLRREYIGRVSTTFPFRAVSDSLSLSIAFTAEYADFAEAPLIDPEPGDLEPLPPELGWVNGPSFTIAYSNVQSYPLSVSPQQGWRGSATIDLRRPEFGSDYSETTFSFRFDKYFQNPWWTRHALNLHLDGAFAVSSVRNPRGYALGGVSPQDVFTSILFQQPRSRFIVRGFEPNVTRGNQFFLTGAEYRYPLYDFRSGFSTVPVFFRQLKGSMFLESGTAYNGFLADADLKTGIGAELSLETQFAYYFLGNIRLGYARGLDSDGINEVYFLYGGGF